MRAVDPEGSPPEAQDELADNEADPGVAAADGQDVPEPAEAPAEPDEDDRIAALERTLKETQDGRLRIAADFDNYRKRARRDADDASRRARDETLIAILSVADNLERALDHADENNAASIAEGVRLVHRQMLAVLEKFDVRPFESVGAAFNPEEHDAVGQIETADAPAGSVVREMARGFRAGSRVLRPAMVVVARPPAPATPEPDAGASSGGED